MVLNIIYYFCNLFSIYLSIYLDKTFIMVVKPFYRCAIIFCTFSSNNICTMLLEGRAPWHNHFAHVFLHWCDSGWLVFATLLHNAALACATFICKQCNQCNDATIICMFWWCLWKPESLNIPDFTLIMQMFFFGRIEIKSKLMKCFFNFF